MQRDTSISSKQKNDLNSIDKGAELLMRRRAPSQNLHKLKKRRTMEQAIIVLSVMVGVLTLGFGVIIGYLVRSYIQDTTPQYSHPEMFDENGNPIPDEIIAFRFEGNQPQDED
tara:strand:- start:765 stop:1103 length:339 start_codon:yes stop_codon:yes gene_type:complete